MKKIKFEGFQKDNLDDKIKIRFRNLSLPLQIPIFLFWAQIIVAVVSIFFFISETGGF